MRTAVPLSRRILRGKFTVDDGCWEWTASRFRNGYGQGNRTVAHRVVYELLVGPVPEGLDLDHLCRNRGCVNPGHLEPVTRRENLRRGETLPAANAIKTHCNTGHEFSEENTYVDALGKRHCRACRRVAMKKADDKRKGRRRIKHG